LSSLKGRDWSCFKNMVSITALSAVGAAVSVGAAGACAKAPELKLTTPASAATAISDPSFSDPSDPFPRPTAVSLFLNV
jgi:hypothetical protein